MFNCQNIPCWNVHGAENSLCPNVPLPKSPYDEKSVNGDKMYMCQYVHRAKRCMSQNVLVMKCPSQNVSCRNVRCWYKLQFNAIWKLWQYGLWSFQTGYTKLQRFLHKNQHTQRKLLNFEHWTNGEPHSSLQKSEFVKLIISFSHYFWWQNWDQCNKMSGKNTHIYFFYFRFKNKRVWAEKIVKKRKKSKNLKVAGNYPSI